MSDHKDSNKIVLDTPAWMLRAEHVETLEEILSILLTLDSSKIEITELKILQKVIDIIRYDKYYKESQNAKAK